MMHHLRQLQTFMLHIWFRLPQTRSNHKSRSWRNGQYQLLVSSQDPADEQEYPDTKGYPSRGCQERTTRFLPRARLLESTAGESSSPAPKDALKKGTESMQERSGLLVVLKSSHPNTDQSGQDHCHHSSDKA